MSTEQTDRDDICYIDHATGESDHMNAHIQTEKCRASSSEGASLAALQHKLIFYKDAANAQRVRAEGAELSLRIEIDNVQKAEQRLAEVTRHLTEAQTSGWCDVCCGTGKPTADVPCMCGGTGLAADAVIHLRERLFKVEEQAEAAEATIATQITALRLAREAFDAHDHWCGHNPQAPGDPIYRVAERAIDAALAAPAAGTEEPNTEPRGPKPYPNHDDGGEGRPNP